MAKRSKETLAPYSIDAFVAHEDLLPTTEWAVEIERALKTMDMFISIHTTGFAQSVYCQQEVGFAICRGVKIVPVKFNEDPVGFIGRYQALLRGSKDAETVASEIVDLLKQDENTQDLYQIIDSSVVSQKEEASDDIPF